MWRKRPPNRSRKRGVERLLAGVPERRVPRVVAEPDRLDEILVQPQRARDDPRDPGRLERVGHPRAVVVAGGVDEDLRLALQAPERLRMHDPVAVALERRAHVGIRLSARSRPRVSYERTASGERLSSSSSRIRSANESADRPPGGTCGQRIRAGGGRQTSTSATGAQMMIGTVPPSTLQAAPVT